jgi:ATP-dependent protease Clp ATPase subunit
MLNIMFEIPSAHGVKKVVITDETIKLRKDPKVITVEELRNAS